VHNNNHRLEEVVVFVFCCRVIFGETRWSQPRKEAHVNCSPPPLLLLLFLCLSFELGRSHLLLLCGPHFWVWENKKTEAAMETVDSFRSLERGWTNNFECAKGFSIRFVLLLLLLIRITEPPFRQWRRRRRRRRRPMSNNLLADVLCVFVCIKVFNSLLLQ